MKTIHETKYLLFNAEEHKGKKTKIVHVVNKTWQEKIATIEWYGSWRQYCFFPNLEFDTVWNNTCLTDILFVINKLMKEREINKPTGE
jgi:hypothetical protein